MPLIDPTSPIGKIRLRIGDFLDLPVLSDEVILSALDDCSGNVPRASALCAQYVLAILSSKTHKKMGPQLEIWSGEHFNNYVQFLKLTILNPHLMTVAPLPYGGPEDENPLVEFVKQWNTEHCKVTTL